MKPLKKISGEILLYFYWLHRRDSSKLHDAILTFQLRQFSQDRKEVGPALERRNESVMNIDELKEYSDGDLLNAIKYLCDYRLITFNISKTNVGDIFLNFEVTAHGVDLIEGIERGDVERNQFNVTFNFKINNEITVESLLKAELGSLIKASLI